MDGTEDMVDGILVDQQAGILGIGEQRGSLLPARRDRQRRKVYAVDEDVLCLLLGKFDGVAQQLALAPVDTAALLDLIDEHQQLLLRHFTLAVQVERLRQQPFPEGEEQIERQQHPNEHAQDGCGEHGEALRAVLGDAFGRDLTENQHHHRDNHGGDRRACIAIGVDEQHRADGGRRNVDDVVADQDGREQPVVLLQKPARESGVGIALFGKGLEPRGAGRGKCGLRGGKVGGKQQTHRHNNDTGCR